LREASDARQNLIGRPGPDERFRLGVVRVNGHTCVKSPRGSTASIQAAFPEVLDGFCGNRTAFHGFILIAAAGVAHFTFWWTMPLMTWPDSVLYARMASGTFAQLRLAQWDRTTTSAYPLLLWLVRRGGGAPAVVTFIQHALAVATPVLVWRMTSRLVSRNAGFFAAVAVALSPFRHYYAQAILTESLTEFFLIAGLYLQMQTASPSPLVLVARRIASGAALGAATLVRANLAPALLLAPILIVPFPGSDRRKRWFWRSLFATTTGAALLIVPWLTFREHRSVPSMNSGAAFQFTLYANALGLPDPVAVDRAHPIALGGLVWRRIADHSAAYAGLVVRTVRALTISIPLEGDVAPEIRSGRGLAGIGPLAGFPEPVEREAARWRRVTHYWLCRLYFLAMPFAWLGLIIAAVPLGHRHSGGAGAIALIPLVCVGLLSLLLQANTRYAFPFEALALGVGLPVLGDNLVAAIRDRR
jgi:4-amino-4-deoxy-L-arabinose transferase-like glycosyltransferase